MAWDASRKSGAVDLILELAIDRLIEEVRKEMLGNFCAYCGKNVCGQTAEELAKEQVTA